MTFKVITYSQKQKRGSLLSGLRTQLETLHSNITFRVLPGALFLFLCSEAASQSLATNPKLSGHWCSLPEVSCAAGPGNRVLSTQPHFLSTAL